MEEGNRIDMSDDKATTDPEVQLIYWPSKLDQKLIRPVVIRGGYNTDDECTILYYLLVPPTLMLDMIFMGLAGAIPAGGGGSVSHRI